MGRLIHALVDYLNKKRKGFSFLCGIMIRNTVLGLLATLLNFTWNSLTFFFPRTVSFLDLRTNHYEIRKIHVFLPVKTSRVAKKNRTHGSTHSCESFITRPKLPGWTLLDFTKFQTFLTYIYCSSFFKNKCF